MTELLRNDGVPIREILETCQVTELSNGDWFYVSDIYADSFDRHFPFKMLASPEGQRLIDAGTTLLDLVDTPLQKPRDRKYYQTTSQTRHQKRPFAIRTFVTREVIHTPSTIVTGFLNIFLLKFPMTVGPAQFDLVCFLNKN